VIPAAPYVYHPFIDPLPWAWAHWAWTLLPLCAAVALVYKSIKCSTMSRVPREAAVIFVWIIVGMVLAAGALAGLVKVMQ